MDFLVVPDNPATPGDLAARGYTGSAAADVQQTWLDVAWRGLRREVRTLDADLAAGLLDVADVIDVVCAAVLRVLRNPDGVESESGAIDDWQESRKLRDSTEDVFFTAAELRRLQPDVHLTGSWSGSMRYL